MHGRYYKVGMMGDGRFGVFSTEDPNGEPVDVLRSRGDASRLAGELEREASEQNNA